MFGSSVSALLDWWATVRLFPIAASTTPRLLTFRRAMLVSNPTLALLAIRKLRIHKSILHNSPLLEIAIRNAEEYTEKINWRDVVGADLIWIWSPPKVSRSLGSLYERKAYTVYLPSGTGRRLRSSSRCRIYRFWIQPRRRVCCLGQSLRRYCPLDRVRG